MPDTPPRPGDWVASRAALARWGLCCVLRWHVASVNGETMRIFSQRYGFRRVTVGRWAVVERPGDVKHVK